MKLTSTLLLGTLGSLTLTAPAQTFTAQIVPAGTDGNQAFGGSLGQEFNVVSPVTITKLGCFDDLSDGLQLPIRVQLFDRTAPATPLLDIEFPPDDPETPAREDGELVEGSRFLAAAPPLNLPAGFQGMIVASGYGSGERNGNRVVHPWTQDDGGGLITFADRRSFWGDAGLFPTNADPGNQYAAGNFQYQANGGLQPGAPAPVLVNGNAQVQLTWTAVTQPVAAATYRILRATSASGPFTQIAAVATTSHTDTGLTNGTVYYYKMVSVTAGGTLSGETPVFSATPYQLPPDQHLAYFTPGNLPGNQNFGGSLGMDFDVQNPITVTWLGVYDADSNGIQPDPGPDGITGNEDDLPRILNVRLYNRDTQEVLATQDFSTEAPGQLIAGMRLIALNPAVELPTGFHGTIAADGYGAGELLRNSGGIPANVMWTLDDGQSSLVFTGTGRYGISPGSFPDTVDASLPAAYAAGTFQYRTTAAVAPGKPVARLSPLISNASAGLAWDAVTTPVAAAKYRIYRYDSDLQTYTLAGETTALTYLVTGLANDQPASFVVRAVSAGGLEGLGSDLLTTTPSAPAAGVAYAVPEGTFGNQSFGGSLGMDFNVVNPVKVTKLGAFDSGADGLFLPITVAIYDRVTGLAVTPLVEFPVDNPETPAREDGDLVESSRFLPLAQPLELSAGFQGSIVAYGYGAEEQNGNAGGGTWTTFGGGSLAFVGTSRWDTALGVLPANPDAGPLNRYAAGTFYFEPTATVATFDANLTITPQPGNQVRLNWTPTDGAVLQRSSDLKAGNWVSVPTAIPGFQTLTTGREFFRLAKP